MLEFLAKDYKAMMIKMLQGVFVNILWTNKKIESLGKKKNRSFKEERNGNFKTEKYYNWEKKTKHLNSRLERIKERITEFGDTDSRSWGNHKNEKKNNKEIHTNSQN